MHAIASVHVCACVKSISMSRCGKTLGMWVGRLLSATISPWVDSRGGGGGGGGGGGECKALCPCDSYLLEKFMPKNFRSKCGKLMQ